MKNIVNYFLLLLLLCGFTATAQEVEMADEMRAEGKIYVVISIIMIVLIGLVVYLFTMDRKLSKMEKMIQEKQKTK
jgi:CcmD family protein